MSLLYPEDIDNRLNWPIGRATRLAKKGKLPHIVLPDGSIRFEWESIEPLLVRVPQRDVHRQPATEATR